MKKCRECGAELKDANAQDVGYCLNCYNILMSDPDDGEDEFEPCAKCDGHDACGDFGCAFENGLGHLVKPDNGML